MSVTSTIAVTATRISSRLIAATVLFTLGGVMIFGVGLSPSPMAHNAAHDSRHAMGFPCH